MQSSCTDSNNKNSSQKNSQERLNRSKVKGSSQRFAHRGQTKELSYGALPPPPVLKRKCDRQWEKCTANGFNSPDLFQRSSLTTHKSVHQTLVIDQRYRFPKKSSFCITTCSNNAACLTHAGTLPWRFSVFCEKNKETISNSRRRIQFLLFFSFSACSFSAGGWSGFFFLFFLLSIAQRNGSKPLPWYESSFVCPRRAEF